MKKIVTGAAALLLALGLAACDDSADSAPQVTKADTSAAAAQTDSTPEGSDSEAPAENADSSADESTAEAAESALQPLADELMAAYPEKLTGSVVYGTSLFSKNCRKLYACEESDLKDAMIVFNNGGGLADEVSIVYPADGDTDKQLRMFDARRQTRYNDFNGYAPEELPKIENAKSFTIGDAAVFIISDSADEIEKIIKEKLQ